MMVVAELFAKLGLDGKEFDRGITAMDKRAGGLVPTLQGISNKMEKVGKAMSTYVTLPVLAGLGLSVKAASDLEETMNKVDVVFGSAAESVKEFMGDAATALGMSKQQAGEATATFGNLLSGTGKSKDEVAKMSENLVQLASDMSSFNNIPMAEALEKIRSGLVGEAEPLRAVGVLLDDAALRQKALSMGIVKNTTDVLSPNNKMLAAYALILEKTKVQQGDFARTSDGLANSIRTATAQLKDMAAAFGTDLIPMAKDLLSILRPLVGAFGSMPGPMRKIVLGFALVLAAVGPLAMATRGLLRAYLGIVTQGPKLLVTLGRFAGGFQNANVAQSAFSGVAGTLGGKLRSVLAAVKNWIVKVPMLVAANTTAALSYSALGLAAVGAGVAIWQMMDAAMAYEDQMRKVDDATKANLLALDALIAKRRALGKDTSWAEGQRQSIIDAGKVSTPWYYYLNPAYALGEGAAKLASGRGLASGGYVPARPGGTAYILGEGGEGEHVIPDSKMGKRGGGDIHVHIGTLVGTDERAARQLSDMVGRHLMRGVRRGMVGQNA